MAKTILLLILCAPLGWFAWLEASHVAALWGMPPTVPIATGDPSDGGDGTSLAESSAWATRVPDEVIRSFLTLGQAPSRNPGGRLTQTLLTIARARDVVDQDPQVRDARSSEESSRREIEDERRRCLDAGKLLDRSAGAESIDTLKRNLNEYKRLIAFDEAFATEVLAEIRLAELDLKAGPPEIEKALESYANGPKEGSRLSPDSTEILSLLKQFEGFVEEFGETPPGLSKESLALLRDQESLWRLLLKLAQAVETANPARRLDLVAGLATEPGTPERFHLASERVALRVAGEYLRKEPLDRKVRMVADEERPEGSFDRGSVRIFWRDPPKGVTNGVTLEASPLDEFTIKRDEVNYFSFPGGSDGVIKGQDSPPLKPTEYSKIIAEFNALRAKAEPRAWSDSYFQVLLRFTEEHKTILAEGGGEGSGGPTLIARIKTMITLIKNHPSLFPGP